MLPCASPTGDCGEFLHLIRPLIMLESCCPQTELRHNTQFFGLEPSNKGRAPVLLLVVLQVSPQKLWRPNSTEIVTQLGDCSVLQRVFLTTQFAFPY